MAYNSMLEDLNLEFLIEDEQQGRDEVDSVSKHVVHFESATLLSKYSVVLMSSNVGKVLKKESKRLRTVSEITLKKFRGNIPYRQDCLAVMVTFRDSVKDDQVMRMSSVLKDICGLTDVLYHTSHLAIVCMEANSYTLLGERFVKDKGIEIQNTIDITGLEVISLESVPDYFVELVTPKSQGEAIQRELSSALVTFCGSFKYLRLHEGEQPDLKPTNPSVSLTLMFFKRAQANAAKLNALLSDEHGSWMKYRPADAVQVPFEQLFLLRNYSAPPLGLISGNDYPGVRISVRFSSKQQEMQHFYRILTAKSPLCNSGAAGTSFMTFPVARNIELQLIYNPNIHTESSSNIAICIRCSDIEAISSASLNQPLTCIDSAGHWEIFDPVGNRIRLFSLAI